MRTIRFPPFVRLRQTALPRPLRGLAPIWLALLLVLGVFALFGIGTTKLSRDALERLDQPAYLGLLSSVGVLAWCAAAVALLFASTLPPRRLTDLDAPGWMRSMGILTVVLMLDDLFLIHETLGDGQPVAEPALYAGYAAFLLAVVVRFRRVLLARTDTACS